MENLVNMHSWETSLRVALVHSFYSSRQPSGENAAVQQQAQALHNAGYDVEVFAQRTDERELGRLYPLGAAATVATGFGPAPDLAAFQPDIIHVHNLFPNYGKTWLKDAPAPVVTTLHNFRPLCAAGTFYRDGKVCTECLDKRSSLPAVKHGCYRGRAQSVPVALGQRFEREPVLVDASAVIVLSEHMRALYATAGVPDTKMHTLPNFMPDALDAGPGDGGEYWLYAGRFSEGKGILDLVNRWPSNRKLLVVGSGELETALRSVSNSGVEVLGQVDRPRMVDLMRGARGLVFPSKWFEGFPMVYAEALASGTPVLAWEPSAVSRLVADEGTGLVGGDSLSATLATADRVFPGLRTHCRAVYESSYTEASWIDGLRRVYDSALSVGAV